MPHLDHPSPPDRTLEWCLAQVPGAQRIASITRLRGGLSAANHRLEISGDGGVVQSFVLRRSLRNSEGIERIVHALRAFADCGCRVATPAIVAVDAAPSICDAPAILMTCLPGRPDVALGDVRQKVGALAEALLALHCARVAAPVSLPRFGLELSRREVPVPPGIVAPDWSEAFDALGSLCFEGAQLIHNDFHIGNALFDGHRVTGIVDFEIACSGPWQFDVSYCRMDLSLVFGLDAGDAFVERYESLRGERIEPLPLWDLAGAVRAYPDPQMWLPSWHDLGRADLSAELVRVRLAEFVERALRRLPAGPSP